MKALNHSRICISFISFAALLCVLLASLMIQRVSSNSFIRNNHTVELHASKTTITYPCPPDSYSASRTCPSDIDLHVALTSTVKGFNKEAYYAYTATVGRVVGEGAKVVWDLTGAWPGFYTATVEVHDGKSRRASSSVTVTIANCRDCIFIERCLFALAVNCYDKVRAGTPITCKLEFNSRVDPITHQPYTYQWSARDSDDNDLSASISKQGDYVSIPTKGLGGKAVITTVEVKEMDPSCPRTASSVTLVQP